jgi:hypothetical protein
LLPLFSAARYMSKFYEGDSALKYVNENTGSRSKEMSFNS